MALVVGEHVGTEGLITLTDLLGAVIADLPVPGGDAAGGLVQRGDGSWLADGKLEADALKERLGLETAPDPDRQEYRTLGGFVMHRLGRVPARVARRPHRRPGQSACWPHASKAIPTPRNPQQAFEAGATTPLSVAQSSSSNTPSAMSQSDQAM